MTEKFDELHSAASADTVRWLYGEYTKQDLRDMDPVCLRAPVPRAGAPHHRGGDLPHPGGRQGAHLLLRQPRPRSASKCWPSAASPWTTRTCSGAKRYWTWPQDPGRGEGHHRRALPEKFNAPRWPWSISSSGTALHPRLGGRQAVPTRCWSRSWRPAGPPPTAATSTWCVFAVIKDSEEMKMVWSDIPTPGRPLHPHRHLL